MKDKIGKTKRGEEKDNLIKDQADKIDEIES